MTANRDMMNGAERDVFDAVQRALSMAGMPARWVSCQQSNPFGPIHVQIEFAQTWRDQRIGTSFDVAYDFVPHVMTDDEMERATIHDHPWEFLALHNHERTKDRPRPAISGAVRYQNDLTREVFDERAHDLAILIRAQYAQFKMEHGGDDA